ncbi:hypothetical protein F0U44_07075 [Nocardioides humilatus]|uniref:DUF11 domain-containing protein n=1 Tax=Nocardioides humilatus TaxID=2607660 RepID=A0A5B1LHQ2_9ACTN|nr:hypothetical protein [Nocardioides humilatus]KAA1420182.1 hypothetical protein F0U44_07075 [Nocardioides humilatus]
MLRNPLRLLAAAIVSVLIGAGLVATAGPAHAVPIDGIILGKGAGNAYTADDGVFQGVIPGKAKTWTFRLINTTSTPQSYAAGNMGYTSPGLNVTWSYGGIKQEGPGHWTYVDLDPGEIATMKLKLSIPDGFPVDDYYAVMQLRDANNLGTVVDEIGAVAVGTYQDGVQENDAFIKTGNQPYVGGDIDQTASSQALKVGQTAKFSIKIVNNSFSPAQLSFYGGHDGCAYDEFEFEVKRGSYTLTEDEIISGYDLGYVNPSKSVTLKLRMKLVTPTDCTSTTFYLGAEGPFSASSLQAAHIPIAYTG